jgi:hypothetical protein
MCFTPELQGAVYMSNERTAVMTGPQQGMVATHQPGQDVFKSVLPEDIIA